ncbi:MAG TPA: DNA mismatch repair protein MutS, partial [Terriglobia bacterium]|nr:DNA mismatch repair protein MutS [Terriglobia bacterium]
MAGKGEETAIDPSAEYLKRLRDRESRRDESLSRIRMVGVLRLAAALLFIALLWPTLVQRTLSSWWLLIPVALFVALALYHDRLFRARDRAQRAVLFYERGLERIENRWQGNGNSQTSYADDAHLYAQDLDLFGHGSLFELLCTARTKSGEETLARWLQEPASRAEILQRQDAVRELRAYLDLREDLAVLGPEVRSAVNPEFMSGWVSAPVELQSRTWRVAIALLVALTAGVFVYGFFGDNQPLLYSLLAVEFLLGIAFRRRVLAVLSAIEEPSRELAVLGLALQRMERESFSSELLRRLQSRLSKEGKQPSQEIASLLKRVEYLNQRRNQFFVVVSLPLMWATQFAFAIEAWRTRCGPSIGGWLRAFGEFEALCALAGYAYEHPDDPFPEIVQGETLLECEELRHPLLSPSVCVPNSIHLGGELQLLLVSGSNMSGKSTLLRTVGINVVLAQAGGPVRAARMKLCVLAIGATLRVQDSLQAGVSRFYAEISRLHDTMKLTEGPLPVLFLLDEILHGTNSHDRAIGAEAVIRGLVA